VKLRRLLCAAALTAAAITSVDTAGAQTGGQTVPCPGSPWNNGWFDTWGNGKRGAVNCSIRDNQIVLDVYNSEGQRTQGAVETWFGWQCDRPSFLQPSPGFPFRIRLRNDTWGTTGHPGCGTWGLPIGVDGASWRQQWITTGTTRAFQCLVFANRTCPNQEGWSDLRTTGINGGPYTMFGVTGSGSGADQSTFATEIVVYLQS
jgi:hypothetical protein